MTAVVVAVVIVLAVILAVAGTSVRILREYERAVVFRLGRLLGQKGPGIVLLIPGIDRMVRVDLRTVTFDIPPQDLITRDNVPAKVNAVTYFRVVDPVKSVIEVERYRAATSQIAQTTLRSVLGKADLDMLLSERERLNEALQQIIDEQTDPWGIKVTTVEIKDVGIPQGMQRAMARQAEAERERRAKVINAEGEFQASERLLDAAQIMSENPASLQLRYLQTLLELGSSQASTIVFPLPIDLLRPLLDASSGSSTGTRAVPRPRPERPEPTDEDTPDRSLEAANGAREIPRGESGIESREELEAEVEHELEEQARRVQAEVDRVQAEIAEKRTP
jgi:regulator of protease activity HflC (stomatin/prohibitin superfamily)